MTSGPEGIQPSSAEAENIEAQKQALTSLLLSLGFEMMKDSKHDDAYVFLIGEDNGSDERPGARISIQPGGLFMQLLLIGSREILTPIIDAVNKSGRFVAVRDDQENSAIGEYFNVMAVKKPKNLLDIINLYSTYITNRIRALRKKLP